MLVKNAIVNMEWDAETFYESKTKGFVVAVHKYKNAEGEEVPICFRMGKAFYLFDNDTEKPATVEEFSKAISQIVKEDGNFIDIADYFPDDYVELSDGYDVNEDTTSYLGLSSADNEDILARVKDLSGYYSDEEEE